MLMQKGPNGSEADDWSEAGGDQNETHGRLT
jgi:hypothetical protein